MSAPLAEADVVHQHVDAAERRRPRLRSTDRTPLSRRHVRTPPARLARPAPAAACSWSAALLQRFRAARADHARARPRQTSACAAARPSPRLPPVTIATFPLSSPKIHRPDVTACPVRSFSLQSKSWNTIVKRVLSQEIRLRSAPAADRSAPARCARAGCASRTTGARLVGQRLR